MRALLSRSSPGKTVGRRPGKSDARAIPGGSPASLEAHIRQYSAGVPSAGDDQVRYPQLRRRLRDAVGNLCDEKYQRRLWVRGDRQSQDELGFDDTLLLVVDELDTFGQDIVGDVLLDAEEAEAFDRLASAVENLIERIGQRGGYADAVAVPEWVTVVQAAQSFRPLLDR